MRTDVRSDPRLRRRSKLAHQAATPPAGDRPDRPGSIDALTRHELIAQAAYFRAQHRGFEPGHEQEDWRAAESEIEAALDGGRKAGIQRTAQVSETT